MKIAINRDKIAFNYKIQEFDSRCSDDAEFVEMTPALQKLIVDAHNRLRNQQAMGETPGFEPAKKMATMVSETIFFAYYYVLIRIDTKT